MKGYSEDYWAKRAVQYNKTSWVKNEDFIDAFLGMLPSKSFKSILEVGPGTGNLTSSLLKKKPKNFYVIDFYDLFYEKLVNFYYGIIFLNLS